MTEKFIKDESGQTHLFETPAMKHRRELRRREEAAKVARQDKPLVRDKQDVVPEDRTAEWTDHPYKGLGYVTPAELEDEE